MIVIFLAAKPGSECSLHSKSGMGSGPAPADVTVAGVTVPAAEQGPPARASESESPVTVTCQGWPKGRTKS